MHLKFRNVNDAFKGIVQGIHTGAIPTEKTPSRNGPTLQIMEPMIITYEKPRERVLFNSARDANPFFHMFESLWMLAGRNDVAPLAYYAKQIVNYSDNGVMSNGAYGYRWRNAQIPGVTWQKIKAEEDGKPALHKIDLVSDTVDQLQVLIDHLRAKPESRRAVLNMWNVEDDLLKIDSSKDVCCNLSVCFSIRETKELSDHPDAGVTHSIWNKCKHLDMTVFNRSNDLIWGALGANVVHFSLLMEYMANSLGVEVGEYNQVSNNLHVYTESNSGWKPEEWLFRDDLQDSYINRKMDFVSLVQDQKVFDREVKVIVDDLENVFDEPFLRLVAQPMLLAFRAYKEEDFDKAIGLVRLARAADWRIAGEQWLLKRKAKRCQS